MLSKIALFKNQILIALLAFISISILGFVLFPGQKPLVRRPFSITTQSASPNSNLANRQVSPVNEYQPEPNGPIIKRNPDKKESATTQDRKELLIKKLPYYSDIFNVEYFQSDNLFLITIVQNPLEENKKKAVDWLKAAGLTNEDLESLKIVFDHAKSVE